MTGAAVKLLVDDYDLLLLDLDGVVYLGEQAVQNAPQALWQLRHRGVDVCYVTNNASRDAGAVAQLLTSLGVPADEGDVVTSGQAAARLLAERAPAGASVLVVGAECLADEIASAGLKPVAKAACAPVAVVAVVQGYSPEIGWRHLAEAAQALTCGALWVATNTDRALPSERGPLPGNGALVAAVSVAVNRVPDIVAGKPEPGLFSAAVGRRDASRPLVVGDRLETDIEGAVRCGYDSLFVLTGAGTAAELLTAPETARPRYLANDLGDLLMEYPPIHVSAKGLHCRDWVAAAVDDTLWLSGVGEPIDALRALCAAAWRCRGDGGCGSLVATSTEAAHACDTLNLPALPRFNGC